MVKCLKCGEELSIKTDNCLKCGALFNKVKINFITYIGTNDSLYGYQKSYKLVLLKSIFEEILNNEEAVVTQVIQKIRQYYLNRYEEGLITDIDVDERIKNIQNSSEKDVFIVMKSQPYKVINEKGFLFLTKNLSGDLVFTLNDDITKSIDRDEIKELIEIINKKLELYFLNKNIMRKDENESSEFHSGDLVTSTEILDLDISKFFELSSRTKNCLKRSDLSTVRKIIKFLEFGSLEKIKNLGKHSIEEVMNLVNRIDKGEDVKEINVIKRIIDDEKLNIHTSNTDISLYALRIFNVSNNVISAFEKLGYTHFSSIKNMSKEKIQDIIGKSRVDEVYKILMMFNFDIATVTEYALTNICSGRNFEIYLSRAGGLNLTQIGNIFGITRSRAQQIEIKMFNLIRPFAITIFKNLVSQYNRQHLFLQEILEVFNNDDFDSVLLYTAKSCKEIEYLDFAELLILKKNNDSDIYEKLTNVAKEFVGDGIDFFSKLDELEEVLSEKYFDYISVEMFLNLLISLKAKFYGSYVSFEHKNYGELCAKIIAKNFKNGINFNSKDEMSSLRQSVFVEYGDLKLPEDDLTFSKRLANYLVLCGRSKYIAPENISINIDTIELVRSYIEDVDYENIYYIEIFNEFEGVLNMTTNISNYQFLHGVLMYFYPNEYNYSRDFLSKRNSGKENKLSERIIQVISANGQAMHKSEVSKRLGGYSEVMILNAVTSSDNIFQWEHNYFNCLSNIKISEEEKEIMKSILEMTLDNNCGYCSDSILFDIISQELPQFMVYNKIKNASNIFYILGCLFKGEYTFNRPHICRNGLVEVLTTKNIAMKFISNGSIIKYSDFADLGKKFKWSEVTMGIVFNDIESEYMRISENEYILKNSFRIPQESIQLVNIAITELISKRSFISLFKFDNFNDFPEVGYEWSNYLLATIINNYKTEYRVVQPKTKDRRYQKGFIVEAKSQLFNLDEIVINEMCKSEINSFNESSFLSFLNINGITTKVIPKELYESKILEYNNEIFSIKKEDTSF